MLAIATWITGLLVELTATPTMRMMVLTPKASSSPKLSAITTIVTMLSSSMRKRSLKNYELIPQVSVCFNVNAIPKCSSARAELAGLIQSLANDRPVHVALDNKFVV